MELEPSPRVVALVLTYRRPKSLDRTLSALNSQTRSVDFIIVVDNDRQARLERGGDANLEIIETGRNLGPAGGIAVGFRQALDKGADKIWCVPDDVEPHPEALERLLARCSPGSVVLPIQHRPQRPPRFSPSWNGSLFDARIVREIGVPLVELFFWAEDTEYFLRLRRFGFRCFRVPEAAVTHWDPGRRRKGQGRDWRLYYEVRNTLHYRFRIAPLTLRGAFRAAVTVLGKLAMILLREPGKRTSLRLWGKGVGDFVRGRLGAVVDPASWR